MEIIQVLFRWIHIVSGILWVGLLYFASFVFLPFAPTIDADSYRKVAPGLMGRVAFWFRWGTAFTWISGVVLLLVVFYHGGLMFDQEHGWAAGSFVMVAVTFLGVYAYDVLFKLVKNSKVATVIGFGLILVVIYGFINLGNFEYRAYVIHTGAMFGTIMAFNVWFRVGPAQKQIIAAVNEGRAPDAEVLALFSMRARHNTYLSVPVIWAMIDAHHAGTPPQDHWWYLPILILLGWIVVYLLYRKAAKVTGPPS